jgi:hypothetical protein
MTPILTGRMELYANGVATTQRTRSLEAQKELEA